MYIKREQYEVVTSASKHAPVLILSGPRQAGKTTLLRHADPQRRFVTLDDLEFRSLAQNDPKAFLERFPPPVLIDEFQYAPQLLPYIKILVDEKRTRLETAAGDYWLTGSQSFSMMEGAQESLAGRAMILNLLGLSRAEIERETFAHEDFLASKASHFETGKGVEAVFDYIVRGDKPELWATAEIDTELYYRSYVQTYVERDVVAQLKIKDVGLFEKFMRLLASRVGQLINLTALAGEVGVSAPTIKTWLTTLERSFQVFVLPPYYRNIGKRALKTPKVYFLDTGLACYFLRCSNSASIAASHLAGQLFENWVVVELIKSYWFKGSAATIYFWRSKDAAEIDIIYESAGKLYPTEIKLATSPDTKTLRAFDKLSTSSGVTTGRRKIICTSKINIPIDENTDIVSALSIR